MMNSYAIVITKPFLAHMERAIEVLGNHLHDPELLEHSKRNDQIGKVIRTVLENDAQTHALLKDWLARLKKNEI